MDLLIEVAEKLGTGKEMLADSLKNRIVFFRLLVVCIDASCHEQFKFDPLCPERTNKSREESDSIVLGIGKNLEGSKQRPFMSWTIA